MGMEQTNRRTEGRIAASLKLPSIVGRGYKEFRARTKKIN